MVTIKSKREIELMKEACKVVALTYEKLEKELNTKIGEELAEEAKINIKPRLRMTTLYAIAQNYNYLVMGTGNLCEAMVGYTTKWGDSASDFNPIANFTVDEVLKIGEILGVPEKIIKKAPSDGLSDKSDEEKMGITYKEVAEYIEKNNNNHVLYRVTPDFKGDNKVASGVEMEAYSVEDNGQGVQFNVYVYNVQPGITINYQTGENSKKNR